MLSDWVSITGMTESGGRVTHIIPVDDLHGHEMSSDCWCQPILDHEYWIATHNSADGREDYENGRRKPS